MGEFLIIFVTAASEQEGAEIGRVLVEEGLAACANIIPRIRSVYRWKGEIWDGYEIPEISAIKLDRGDLAYLEWIKETTSSEGD